jgi:hypothetical protein
MHNKNIAKKYGTPHNASTGSGGPDAGTEAASRGKTNSSLSKGKFLPDAKAGTYGVKGVGK